MHSRNHLLGISIASSIALNIFDFEGFTIYGIFMFKATKKEKLLSKAILVKKMKKSSRIDLIGKDIGVYLEIMK